MSHQHGPSHAGQLRGVPRVGSDLEVLMIIHEHYNITNTKIASYLLKTHEI